MFLRFIQPKEFPFSDQFKLLRTMLDVLISIHSPKFRHLKISCQHWVKALIWHHCLWKFSCLSTAALRMSLGTEDSCISPVPIVQDPWESHTLPDWQLRAKQETRVIVTMHRDVDSWTKTHGASTGIQVSNAECG